MLERNGHISCQEGVATFYARGSDHILCQERMATFSAKREWPYFISGGSGHILCQEGVITYYVRREWSHFMPGGGYFMFRIGKDHSGYQCDFVKAINRKLYHCTLEKCAKYLPHISNVCRYVWQTFPSNICTMLFACIKHFSGIYQANLSYRKQ